MRVTRSLSLAADAAVMEHLQDAGASLLKARQEDGREGIHHHDSFILR
jgi:hypothetical protein